MFGSFFALFCSVFSLFSMFSLSCFSISLRRVLCVCWYFSFSMIFSSSLLFPHASSNLLLAVFFSFRACVIADDLGFGILSVIIFCLPMVCFSRFRMVPSISVYSFLWISFLVSISLCILASWRR